MKEEIKEILELYKNDDIEYYNLVSDLGYDKLLDYITNLQEELFNEKERFNDYLIKEISYKQRNEKAIEYIENEYEENIIITDYADNPITPQELYGDLLNILKR